jgi:cytochrome P450
MLSMTDTPEKELMQYPFPRSSPLRPPDAYEELRAERPVCRAELPSGCPVWVISSHELTRQILTDPRAALDRFHPGFPHLFRDRPPPEQQREAKQFDHSLIGRAFSVDGPEHSARKRLLLADFTARGVQPMRPRIQEIVDERIDAMLSGDRPADLVKALALPVPSQVISELLGVPLAEQDFFQEQTRVMVDHAATLAERRAANVNVLNRIEALVMDREQAPGDGLIGRMVQRNREAELLSHAELTGVAAFLLIAGYETTANMISLGTVGLLEHADQFAALRADSALVPGAVDELLRYFGTSDPAGSRVAIEDIEIDGEVIPAGEGIIASAVAANWDETVFEHPELLDVRRDARRHLAFGYGAHQCLGLHLARLELELTLGTLVRRVPGLRLASTAVELSYKTGENLYGIHRLPVTW